MHGTFISIYVLAFDLDDRGQPVPAFDPRPAATEDAAMRKLRILPPGTRASLYGNAEATQLWAKKENPRSSSEQAESGTLLRTMRAPEPFVRSV